MPIRNRIVEIKQIAGRDLANNPLNPRQHPSAQRSALRGVLEDVGAAGVLLAYPSPRNDGKLTLIDGHLRSEDNPDFLWTVAILDTDDAEADKLLATHDPLGAMAQNDPELMRTLLNQIDTQNVDVQQLLDEIAKANAFEMEPASGLTDPDQIPALAKNPISQPGDLWTLGKHRLLVGDSSRPDDLDRLLGGDKIHLVHTDPPYNVSAPSPKQRDKVMHRTTSRQTGRARERAIAGDTVTDEQYKATLLAWFTNAARALLPGHAFYIWGGYSNLGNYMEPIKQAGLRFAQIVVWDKQAPVLSSKDFMTQLEICFHGWKTGAAEPVCWLDFKNDMAVAFYGWRTGAGHRYFGPMNARDLWHVKKVPSSRMIHLTEKPVELAVRAMQYSSKRGEHVLDLFGGSGSTLIAAEMIGRQARLMEIDLPYADCICQRYLDFTGVQPVREADGNAGLFKPSTATQAA